MPSSTFPLSNHRLFAAALVFAVVPLCMISVVDILISLRSLALSAWVASVRFVSPAVVPDWASSALPTYFLDGVQLLSIGILGEYVVKIYMETKRRPRLLIERVP